MLKTHQNCNGSVKGGGGGQGKNFPLAFHSDFAGMFGWGRLGLGKTSIANEGFNSGIARKGGGGFTLARIFRSFFSTK